MSVAVFVRRDIPLSSQQRSTYVRVSRDLAMLVGLMLCAYDLGARAKMSSRWASAWTGSSGVGAAMGQESQSKPSGQLLLVGYKCV